jgi:hypothetical protein
MAMAEVIDLAQFRGRRPAEAARCAAPAGPPIRPTMRGAFMPVWVLVPVWMPAAAAHRSRA